MAGHPACLRLSARPEMEHKYFWLIFDFNEKIFHKQKYTVKKGGVM